MSCKKELSDVEIVDKLIANDIEVVKMVFFSPSKYKERLDLAILQILKIKSESNTPIVRHYLHALNKSRHKRLKEMKVLVKDLPFEQILQDDFLFFLARRRNLKEYCGQLNDLLEENDHKKMSDFLWGNGNLYDDIITKEIGILQNTYGKSPDFEELKFALHKHLTKNSHKLLSAYDYLTSIDIWRKDMAHHFIEGRPRVDLITSDDHSSLDLFLNIECNSKKLNLKQLVNSFKINGKTFITPEDFIQQLSEIIIGTHFKDFVRFKYECSIFAYFLRIATNLLIDMKYKEEERLGMHPVKPTKKEEREKRILIKNNQLERQARLLIDALGIPGSKEYFGIDKTDDTLDVMKYIMEELHIKCLSNKEKKERRKTLPSEIGKDKGYISLLVLRARKITEKIQSKLAILLKEKEERDLTVFEKHLYDTLFNIDHSRYEE